MTTQTRNEAGQWVPAIPLPFYLAFGRCRCSCGETRWSERSYREHYALSHIIEGEPADRPPTLAEAAAELRRVNRRTPVGGYAPPNPGVASKAGAPRPPSMVMHWNAGGQDSVACGMPGYSDTDPTKVTCPDCARVMRLFGLSTEPLPVGTVVVYPSHAPLPEGWRWADGSWVNCDEYPALFKAIGLEYGGGDGKHYRQFRLPDFGPGLTHIIRVG